MKNKSKVGLSISIDKQVSNLIKNNITNRSKYIEWLIYQDLKDKGTIGLDKIII
jgi:hypothetical protein